MPSITITSPVHDSYSRIERFNNCAFDIFVVRDPSQESGVSCTLGATIIHKLYNGEMKRPFLHTYVWHAIRNAICPERLPEEWMFNFATSREETPGVITITTLTDSLEVHFPKPLLCPSFELAKSIDLSKEHSILWNLYQGLKVIKVVALAIIQLVVHILALPLPVLLICFALHESISTPEKPMRSTYLQEDTSAVIANFILTIASVPYAIKTILTGKNDLQIAHPVDHRFVFSQQTAEGDNNTNHATTRINVVNRSAATR